MIFHIQSKLPPTIRTSQWECLKCGDILLRFFFSVWFTVRCHSDMKYKQDGLRFPHDAEGQKQHRNIAGKEINRAY